jgi:hypothetical protein
MWSMVSVCDVSRIAPCVQIPVHMLQHTQSHREADVMLQAVAHTKQKLSLSEGFTIRWVVSDKMLSSTSLMATMPDSSHTDATIATCSCNLQATPSQLRQTACTSFVQLNCTAATQPLLDTTHFTQTPLRIQASDCGVACQLQP